MRVGLNTAAAGGVNGAVIVEFASDGAGTSGLGITALPSQSVGVSGTIEATGSVFRLASASAAAPNPVDFGNVRVGSVATQALTIANTRANDGFSERLNASIGGATAGVTAAGSFSLLGAAGEQQHQPRRRHRHRERRARAAARATIALASDGTGTSGLGVTPLAAQTVAVNGAVYRLANPTLTPPSVTLAARVGDAAPGARSRSRTPRPTPTRSGSTRASARVSARLRGLGLGHRPGRRRDEQRARRRARTPPPPATSAARPASTSSRAAPARPARADAALAGPDVALAGRVYTPAVARRTRRSSTSASSTGATRSRRAPSR